MEIRCNHLTGSDNAIQDAIDALPPEGGRVTVPAGDWYCGPLHLKSAMELHLEAGARVIFSSRFEDYLPSVFTRWEGVECYNYSPLIYARDCINLAITGQGTFVGNGSRWWAWKKAQKASARQLAEAEKNGIPVSMRQYGTADAALRPSFLQLVHCTHVLLKDFTIEDGPMWTIHPVYCQDLTARGLKIRSSGPNTDGFNPDSCRDVLIEDCSFMTGANCISITSGMNEDGRRVNMPSEHIEIRRCFFQGGHAAVTIGAGISGGVRDVFVHECIIRGSEIGIRISSLRGTGGYARDIRFENIKLTGVKKEAVQISARGSGDTETAPVVLDGITLKNITGSSRGGALSLAGLSDVPSIHLTVRNVRIDSARPDPVAAEA